MNGSFGVQKAVFPKSSYNVQSTDFTIVAEAGINVNLLKASSVPGMILFIKSNTTGTVTVKPATGDVIDGSSSATLVKQYSGVALISNGYSQWFIISKL